MLDSVPRMQAMDLLEDPEYAGRLDMEKTYELAMIATENEETAQELASERGMQRLREGLTP